MNYGALGTELVQRLRAHFAAGSLPDDDGQQTLMSKMFKAAEGPENEEEAKQQSQWGKVYVSYAGSDYQDTRGTDAVSQEETIHIMLVLEGFTKRGYNGIYNLIEQVNKCLVGYRPQNSTTRMVLEEGFKWTEFENGSIKPTMKMKFNTLCAQSFDDSEPPFYTGTPIIEFQ